MGSRYNYDPQAALGNKEQTSAANMTLDPEVVMNGMPSSGWQVQGLIGNSAAIAWEIVGLGYVVMRVTKEEPCLAVITAAEAEQYDPTD